MPDCIVPGCPRDAQNNLGIRLRRPNTSAIWAPNTEAFICDLHAESGARILVFYEATDADRIEIDVRGATPRVNRVTEIRHSETPAEAMADQVRDIGVDP